VRIDLNNVKFEVDPMTEHKIQMQMRNNPRFAEILNINITDKIYGYINYKIKMRENINFAIKGETRCLAGDTLIPTNEGVKRIKDIRVGEKVLSYATSPSRRYFTWMPVTEKFKYENRETLVIKFTDGSELKCTPNHPLYKLTSKVKIHSKGANALRCRGAWVEASKLKSGDKILSHKCPFFKIIRSIEKGRRETVYDMHIPQTHCFISNGVLSHNSGKSTVAMSFGVYISSLTHVPFTPYHICANESEYYQKVKGAKFNEVYQIDEQKESKWGIGSFREEMSIMDIQNIVAKQCIHTIWIYPTDFIARNSVYGFETYGKDLNYKLVRCIVYDLRKSILGLMQPLGYVIVPKYQDPAYQNLPEDQWSEYRWKNKYELNRPDFDSLLEELYEQKKDEWIKAEQRRETGYHHKERFKLGLWLKKLPEFQNAGNKKKQRIIARQIFPDLTEQEIDEVVEIARMDIDLEDIEKMKEKFEETEKKDREKAGGLVIQQDDEKKK